MNREELIKEDVFEAYGEVKLDSKNRVTMGRIGPVKVSSYRVYRNSLGQIILDPQATIPAHEAWLFKNDRAKGLVQKGLQEAKAKRLVKADEDYSKYVDD